jgi:hypothetical protein
MVQRLTNGRALGGASGRSGEDVAGTVRECEPRVDHEHQAPTVPAGTRSSGTGPDAYGIAVSVFEK